MRINRNDGTALIIVIGLITASCTAFAERPPAYQFCLNDHADRSKLNGVLAEIAEVEGIQFFDWSAETDRQLRRSERKFGLEASFPIINVGVRRKDGLGFGVNNTGLHTNNVAFAFTEGDDAVEAKALCTARARAIERYLANCKRPKG